MNGIIELLTLWIKDIAIVFVLITIIEIILPNDNMKRYIDMVTGLLVLMVIVSPFVKFLKRDFNMDREVLYKTVQQIDTEYRDHPKLLELQGKQLKDMYIDLVKEEIGELIKEFTEHQIHSVNLSIYEDEKNYGKIKDLEIVLREIKEESPMEESIMVGKIEEISIGKKREKASQIKEEKNDEEIIRAISENFDIPKKNIKVFIYKEGENDG